MMTDYYRQRLHRIQAAMLKDGFQGLLLVDNRDIAYLCGCIFAEGALGKRVVFVPVDRDPICVCPIVDAQRLEAETWVRDVRPWRYAYGGAAPQPFWDVVREVYIELKLEGRTVGITFNGVPMSLYQELQTHCPPVTYQDAGPLLETAMLVKDPDEIALLRTAAAIADVGLESALSNLKTGLSETEVAGLAEVAMRAAGCENLHAPTHVGFGPRSAIRENFPYHENLLRRGDVLTLDVHPTYRHYNADCKVTASMGKVVGEFREIAAFAKAVIPELISQWRPGAKMAEVEAFYRNRLKQAGYDEFSPWPLAHGIGTIGILRVPPHLEPSSDTTLERDMIVVPSVMIYKPGLPGLMIEFMLRVDSPPELLNKVPLEVIELTA